MESKRMKVLCPVQRNDDSKKAVWRTLGIAFENKDGSINVYLDAYPVNGKLQLREFDDDDRRVGEGTRFQRNGSGFGSSGFDSPASASAVGGASGELPF